MDTQGAKHKNSNKDPCGLSLSPIIEMDEYYIFGSTVSEEQSEKKTEYLQGETNVFTEMDPFKDLSEIDDTRDKAINNRPCSIQLPVTPPEVLKKRICNLESHNKYLSRELDQLTEFTQLEKQVIHSECISKDQIRSREDEFFSLNEKVQHLMKENLDLKNKLEQRDADFQELKEKLTKFSYHKCEIERSITLIVQKLREKLQDGTEEIIKNKPSLEWLLRNKDFEKSEVDLLPHPIDLAANCLEGFKDLFEVLLTDKNNSKLEYEALCLNNEELRQVKEQQYAKKLMQLELDISISEKESNQIQEGFSLVDLERKELSVSLSVSEMEATKHLLDETNLQKTQLQNEIEHLKNLVTIDCFHQEFKLFLNEVEDLLDSLQFRSLKELFISLQNNVKLQPFFNIITNSNTQTIFTQFIDKFYNKIDLFDNEINILRSVRRELDSHLRNCESETNDLKIKSLEYHVIELEDSLKAAHCEKAHIEEKCAFMKMKTIEQLKAIATSEYKLKEAVDFLEATKVEKFKLQKEIDDFRNLSIKDDALQEVVSFISNELENIISSSDCQKRFKDVCDIEQKDDIFSCVMNPTIQNTLFHLFDKLKIKLNHHNDEFNHLHATVKDLKKRIEQFECDTNRFKTDFKVLDHQVKNELHGRIIRLEELYNIAENEKVQLHDRLSMMTNESKDLEKALCIAELKLKESESLLEEKCKLQKEFENLAKDGVHETVSSVLHELEVIVDTCCGSENLKEIFDNLQENLKLLPCLNFMTGSQNQIIFSNVLKKLEIKLHTYNKGYEQMSERVKELNISINHLENENLHFKNTIKLLENEQNILKRDTFRPNRSGDCSEELKTLREMMANEVTCLDYDENIEALMGYSSVEIFSKLMQNIIKKEGEISSDFEKHLKSELEKTQEIIEKLNNKLKSKESWIVELEADNEKINKDITVLKEMNCTLESKMKNLLNDLKSSSTEISGLKSKVLEITNENDALYSEINVLKELGKTERDKLRELNEEVQTKNNTLASLECKLSCMVSQEKVEMLREGKSLDNSKGDFSSNQEILNFVCPSVLKPNLSLISRKENERQIKPVAVNHVESITEFKKCIIHELEKEQTLLKDVFMPYVCNVDFGDQLFKFSDELFVLKELLQSLANKIIEMEASHANSLHQLQSAMDIKTKEINDFKLSILKIDKELECGNKNLKSDSFNNCINKPIFDNDFMSLKNELELIKDECVNITNKSNEFEASSMTGIYLIQSLNEKFEVFKEESLKKSKLLKDLYKTIELEQRKSEQQKMELNMLTTQNSSLIFKNNLLQDQINDLQSQTLDMAHVISRSEINIPDKINDTCGKISYITDTFKENEENLKFFVLQFYLISLYIKNVENEIDSKEEQKEHITKESCLLNEQMTSLTKQFEQTKIFVNNLIQILPTEVSSLDEALEIINQIFTEYTGFKEIQVGFLQERKLAQEKLSQQLQEFKSVVHLNSSLKMELAKCEDSIRNLRSELRNGRIRQNGEHGCAVKRLLPSTEKAEAGSQTESLCCNNLQKQVLKQKETSDVQNVKITSLKLKIEKEDYPYKKKVFELERALSQAKERIKTLKYEATEQKNYIRDLIEAYQQPQV